MHTSKINRNRAVDFAEKTESEICSPKIQLSTFHAESKIEIDNTKTMRHREILPRWARQR